MKLHILKVSQQRPDRSTWSKSKIWTHISRISCIKSLQNLIIEGYEWQAVERHLITCFTLCVNMPSRLSVIDLATDNFKCFLAEDVPLGLCVGFLLWIRTVVISTAEAKAYCSLTRSAVQNENRGETVQWYVAKCGREINVQQRFSICLVLGTL